MKYKKKIFKICCLFSLVILSNCAQSTIAMLGPAMTGAKTGNVYQSGFSYASSNIIKKQFGQSPTEYIKDKLTQIDKKKNKLTQIDNKDKTNLTTGEKNNLKNAKLSLNLKNNDTRHDDFMSAVKAILK